MVIAALVAFAILLVAWIFAPSAAHARRRPRAERPSGPLRTAARLVPIQLAL